MTTGAALSDVDPTADGRAGFSFQCGGRDCTSMFTGDDLTSILKQGARHWNREHGDELEQEYQAIDEVVLGGHHIQGNAYEVRKYHVYVTPFDLAQRLGAIDAKLAPADGAFPECHCRVPDDADRVEDNPDDVFCDAWKCDPCAEQEEIERKQNANATLTEWST